MADRPGPVARPAHDWEFLASSVASARTVIALTIAVCRACGLIRTAVAQPQRESQVDLRGECPGR